MTKSNTLRMVGALVLLLGVGQAAFAQRSYDQRGYRQRGDDQRGYGQRYNRWEYLGEANVDGRSDHDRIVVGRDDGRFRSIQIHVENAPIQFQRVVVHYANGGSEQINLRYRIPAGGESRVIDLRGRDRAISSVEFWYSRANWRSWQKPKVRLYGR